jgi:hypothetical protein
MSVDAGVFGGVAVAFSSYCCVYNSLYGLYMNQRKASIQSGLEKESEELGLRIQKAAAKIQAKQEKQQRLERNRKLPVVVTCGGESERAVMLAARCLGLRHVQLGAAHRVSAEVRAIERRRRRKTLDILGHVSLPAPETANEKSRRVRAGKSKRQLSGLLVWQTASGAGPSAKPRSVQTADSYSPAVTAPVEAALIPASKTPSAPPGADAAQPTRARNVSFSRPPYASSDGLILQTVLYNLLENFTDLSAEPGVAPPALLQTYAQEVLSLEQLRAAEANARARDPVQLAVSAAAPAVSRDGPALQRWEHGSSGRGAQYVGRMGAVSSRQLASYHVDLEEVDDQDKLFYMHLVKSLNVHPLAILNGGLSAYGRR